MTFPPTGPYGQSPPERPPGSPGPWAQPAPAGYGAGYGGQPPAADGFGPAGAPQFEPWATGPDPWRRQQDLWGQQPGIFPDPGQTPPRRKRTGLIAGIVAAVVVLAGGGVTAAVLLTGKGGDTGGTAAPPAGGVRTAPAGAPSSSSSPGTDPASVAKALVQSINQRDIPQYVSLLCVKPEQALMDELKVDWDGDSTLHAGLDGQPAIKGSQATVTVRLTYHGQSMTPVLNLKQQGSAWCADIPT